MADKVVHFRVTADGTQAQETFKATTGEVRQAKRELRNLTTEGERYQQRVSQIQNLHSKGLLGEGRAGEVNRDRLLQQARMQQLQGRLGQFRGIPGVSALTNLLGPQGALVAGLTALTYTLNQHLRVLEASLKSYQVARSLGVSQADYESVLYAGEGVISEGARQGAARRVSEFARRRGMSNVEAARWMAERATTPEAARALFGSAEYANIRPEAFQQLDPGVSEEENRLYGGIRGRTSRAMRTFGREGGWLGLAGMMMGGGFMPLSMGRYNRAVWGAGEAAGGYVDPLPVRIIQDETSEGGPGGDF